MLHSLEKKNILIVPLSLFICFNKKLAAEKFANLFGKFFDDMFSCDEAMKEHEKFSEGWLQKILTSKIVADFNLGKKTKHEFIAELLSFLGLPSSKSTDIEVAWNSLIEFDRESREAFYALIKLTLQGKSIYFIGDTNELHAKKILDLFKDPPPLLNKLSFLENLPENVQALPFPISRVSDWALGSDDSTQIGMIYFCLSYAYKILIEQPQNVLTRLFTSPSGLLTHLKTHFNGIGKTQDDIIFVNPYTKERAIIKQLALESISKENFYTDLIALTPCNATATFIPLQIDPYCPTDSTCVSVSGPHTH
ncbi:MAG: hypothetical protein WA659_01385 [Candidatus Aquirickettsiella sp.]